MNLSDILITMAQAPEIEQPSLFPFPFDLHILFVCISTLFLAFQFYREKKPYQLIMCIAIPISLAIWLSENRTLFYAIGIAEAVLLLAAFVTAVIFRKKEEPDTASSEAVHDSSETAEAENDVKDVESRSSGTEETESEKTES